LEKENLAASEFCGGAWSDDDDSDQQSNESIPALGDIIP
jgi:hypothetical protein